MNPKARRTLGLWRGASEAHIQSDLQRASNEARGPKDKRISAILNANWNEAIAHWEETADLAAELKRTAEFGCRVVAQDDAEYPELLRQIYDPPVVISETIW